MTEQDLKSAMAATDTVLAGRAADDQQRRAKPEVLTRAQQRYASEEARASELETDIKAMAGESSQIEAAIAELVRQRDALAAELKDARIEHKSVVASLNLMRSEGIHL